jgi:adenine-specific DNA-methyltransferase
MKTTMEQFQTLLRKLFQFDSADLDFGIYRILNHKREQIEDFIANSLPQLVEESFLGYLEVNKAVAAAELEKKELDIIDKLGEDAFDEQGNLARYTSTKLGKQYLDLKKKIAQYQIADELRNRVFNDLFMFFSRYYEDGDFISKRRYARNETYAIPYNGEEVVLYWANKDQYYIKTDEQFKFYRFEVGEIALTFELRNVSSEEVTETSKRYIVLTNEASVVWEPLKNVLNIFFEYRPLTEQEEGKYGKTQQQKPQEKLNQYATEVILKKLQDLSSRQGTAVTNYVTQFELAKHLNQFTRRNTADFFIHKDLLSFLRRELNFFIKNEVVLLDELLAGAEGNLRETVQRGQVVREIANRIIEFLAQIEDFQRKLFEKKKFVVRTDYCVTIDRVPEELWSEVLSNDAQIREWKALYALDDTSTSASLFTKELNKEFLSLYPSLMLDTSYFSDEFKWRMLSHFDDLDDEIDGILIKSECFQTLTLLAQKYGKLIKCVYIDPPYNTGNDEFIYKDRYQHSSWLSMMSDRIARARDLIEDDGVIFVNIDDNEVHNLKNLLLSSFGQENFVTEIEWQKRYTRSNNTDNFTSVVDHILVFQNTQEFEPNLTERDAQADARYSNPDNDPRGPWKAIPFLNPVSPEKRPNLCYEIVNPFTQERIYPEKKAWRRTEDVYHQYAADNRIWWGSDGKSKSPSIKRFLSEVRQGMTPINLWDYKFAGHTDLANNEIKDLFGYKVFDTPKPTKLVSRIIQSSERFDKTFIILDFFAGSGTTAHAAINLNREDDGRRKYILVEMGDWFDTVLLPRVKKVVFSQNWSDGKPEGGTGVSQFVKYHVLEQYEDTLNNLRLPKERDGQSTLEMFGDDYLLHYMLEFETRESPPLFNSDMIKDPFANRLMIRQGNEIKECLVDLVETFNYLLGIHVKRVSTSSLDGRLYRAILGEKDSKQVVIVWRPLDGITEDESGLTLDKQHIETKIIADFLGMETKPDRLFVNGPCFAENSEPIELELSKRMSI